jgi:hypothetical protein
MALEVFYSYAHEDEGLRDDLDKQLVLLQRQGLIKSWHDRQIGGGDEWRGQINAHLRSAHIILLLISADFLASYYCYDFEMQFALQRHAAHEAIVIPIILRPVNWAGAPFAHLQALPRDGKPVTTWSNRDEAFVDIAQKVREIVLRFQPSKPDSITENHAANELMTGDTSTPRVLAAAIPSHIVKDRAAELLVLIHLPESQGLKGALLDEDTEATPEDVRSKPFSVIFPRGIHGRPEPLKASVKLVSRDFMPPEQTKNIFIPPEGDSEICHFMLTPVKVGRLAILVELHWEEALRGSRSLRTECIAEVESVPVPPRMTVLRVPVEINVGAPVRTLQAKDRQWSGPYADMDAYQKRDSETIRTESSLPYAAPSEAPFPAQLKRSSWPTTMKILSALIIAIPMFWASLLYFAPKPNAAAKPTVVSGQVLNAASGNFVPDAQIVLEVDDGTEPVFKKYTDSNRVGNYSLILGPLPRTSSGKIVVLANGFEPLEKKFVFGDLSSDLDLHLIPQARPDGTHSAVFKFMLADGKPIQQPVKCQIVPIKAPNKTGIEIVSVEGQATVQLVAGSYNIACQGPDVRKQEIRLNVSPDNMAAEETRIVFALACKDRQMVTAQCRNDFAEKQFSEAQKSCTVAVQCNPEEADNFQRLAKVAYLRQDYDEALQMINIAARLNPNDWDNFYSRAKIYYHENKLEAALPDINRAVELCGDRSAECADSYYLRGRVYARQASAGKENWDLWERAVQDIAHAIARAKDPKLIGEYRQDLRNPCDEYFRTADQSHHTVSDETKKLCKPQ